MRVQSRGTLARQRLQTPSQRPRAQILGINNPVQTHVHTHIYHCRLYQPQGHPSRTAPVDTFARKRTHICVRRTKHASSRPARARVYNPACRPDRHTHTSHDCRVPAPAHPFLPHPRHRPRPECRSRGRAGPGACVQEPTFLGALLLCASALSSPGWGRGRLRGAEPSPGCLPTPLGRDFRDRGPGDSDKQRPHPPLLASLLPPLPALWPDRGRQPALWPRTLTGVQILAPPHELAPLSGLSFPALKNGPTVHTPGRALME